MASSRKPPSGKGPALSAGVQGFLQTLKGKRIAVALSGGIDSVVLLHLLKDHPGLSAIHVHHGLSPNADAWTTFCKKLCKDWKVPLAVHRVKVRKTGKGLEAAARDARYGVFKETDSDCIVLAHHQDDQAETVLMNLLRGAGVRGASGMRAFSRFEGKLLGRPLLDVPRAALAEYAQVHGLKWIEDESNADETFTRNFIRRRVAPLLETRFPQWKQSLARAAGHFSRKEASAQEVLRSFLEEKGLKAPSEAKLIEMLKQLTSGGARTRLEHDGKTLRVYRDKIFIDSERPGSFVPVPWKGERTLKLSALGGELRFKAGEGIDARLIKGKPFVVRLRSGGERLQLHPRRPRRTLKNLFQEAGVPSWARERMPLLFCGKDLVWVPGLGVDVRYQGRGLMPEWHVRTLPALERGVAGSARFATCGRERN
jgi:tRNA(Ile)-lysidine synthase